MRKVNSQHIYSLINIHYLSQEYEHIGHTYWI